MGIIVRTRGQERGCGLVRTVVGRVAANQTAGSRHVGRIYPCGGQMISARFKTIFRNRQGRREVIRFSSTRVAPRIMFIEPTSPSANYSLNPMTTTKETNERPG
eukprot:scaffold7679_cov258-Pinguiococcus_pyrenoidosus.AAC.2